MYLPKNIKNAIFDLDGTLLDSMNVWNEVDVQFLAKRGIPYSEEYVETVKNLNFPDAAAFTIARYHLAETPEEVMAEWLGGVKQAYTEEIKLKPFTRELLEKLHREGVKLGVATSSKPELFLPALRREGVERFFSVFATTEELGCGKDSPAIYLETAKRLGCEPCDCAVFEDILLGVKSAKAGGFYTVAVFDAHAAEQEQELRENSDLFIVSFSELL